MQNSLRSSIFSIKINFEVLDAQVPCIMKFGFKLSTAGYDRWLDLKFPGTKFLYSKSMNYAMLLTLPSIGAYNL